MSKRRPAMRMEGADYSHFERFCSTDAEGEHAIDLSRLLHNLRFSSEPETGLELVDILVTATRRALVGNLHFAGWRNIRRLMVHRPDHYIKLIVLGEKDVIYNSPHADVVRYFSTGGKLMVTPATLRAAASANPRS
jgi:hypothetical protein